MSEKKKKLTKRMIDALPIPSEGDAWVWDIDPAGFGLRVRASGRKTYLLEYRPGTGGRSAPKRRITIGIHGSPWTVDTARDEARRLLGLVAVGEDPALSKAEERKAETVEELCQKFLTEHVAAKRKDRTADEYRRLIDRIILPALGKRKVHEVTRQEIAKLHHACRATPYQANRVLAVLSKLFSLAEAWGIRTDGTNPCRHIEKFKEEKRERFLSDEETARLADALAGYSGSPHVVAAIKLLLFTGARMGEILGLRWEDVDFDRGEVRLADSKTGAKTLRLPPPALVVLQELPRLQDNPFVIAGQVAGKSLVNLEKPWRAIRNAAGLNDVRLHDLRHHFASVAASSGNSLLMIGKLLGHTQAQTTARYAHLADDPVRAVSVAVAGKIEAAMRGEGAQIVGITRKK